MNFYIYGYLVLFGVVFGILAYIVLSKPKKLNSNLFYVKHIGGGGGAPGMRLNLSIVILIILWNINMIK